MAPGGDEGGSGGDEGAKGRWWGQGEMREGARGRWGVSGGDEDTWGLRGRVLWEIRELRRDQRPGGK